MSATQDPAAPTEAGGRFGTAGDDGLLDNDGGLIASVERDDPLLSCLVYLTHHYERPRTPEALRAGLPDGGGPLTPKQFVLGAERFGLAARVVRRPLPAIGRALLPTVLILENGRACVLTDLHDGDGPDGGEATIARPEFGGGVERVPLAVLAHRYAGFAILARPRFLDPASRASASDGGDADRDRRSWFWGVMLENWWIYALVGVAAVMVNMFALAMPLFIMTVYDRVVPNNAMDTLWVLAVGVMLALLFDFILRGLRGYLIDTAGRRADVVVGTRLFDQLLDLQIIARPGSTGAFANILREFETVREFFTSATLATLVDLPFVMLFILVVAVIGGPLAWVLVAAAIIAILICCGFQIPLARTATRAFKQNEHKHGLLVEAAAGLETIKSVGAAGVMRHRWESAIAAAARQGEIQRNLSQVSINLVTLVQQMATVGTVIVGVGLISDGDASPGVLIAAVILSSRALAPLAQAATLITRYNQAMTSLRSLNRLMALPTERPADKNFLQRHDFQGRIVFKDVTFTYPTAALPALNAVSLEIKPGERVGIVGPIGSGKSTMMKLILNLLAPTGGAVQVDGADLRQIDPANLRHAIGHVPQDVLLFRGTVRDNIAIAAPQADDAMVLRAARRSGVEGFIGRNPMGYEAPIGERGEGLSGGQRQAIALARALLLEPPILLLDEPTSSMDTDFEAQFRRRLESLLPGRTLVLATHRMSLLTLVDRVLVLKDGQIVADGPREELLRRMGLGSRGGRWTAAQ